MKVDVDVDIDIEPPAISDSPSLVEQQVAVNSPISGEADPLSLPHDNNQTSKSMWKLKLIRLVKCLGFSTDGFC